MTAVRRRGWGWRPARVRGAHGALKSGSSSRGLPSTQHPAPSTRSGVTRGDVASPEAVRNVKFQVRFGDLLSLKRLKTISRLRPHGTMRGRGGWGGGGDAPRVPAGRTAAVGHHTAPPACPRQRDWGPRPRRTSAAASLARPWGRRRDWAPRPPAHVASSLEMAGHGAPRPPPLPAPHDFVGTAAKSSCVTTAAGVNFRVPLALSYTFVFENPATAPPGVLLMRSTLILSRIVST